MPEYLQRIACPIADATKSTLRISCPEGSIEIVDKTSFGRNATRVPLDGTEAEKTTRGRGKKYMLSASAAEGTGATLNCRLVSRGDGWHTRSERFLSPEPSDGGQVLVERHVLVRPGQPDVSLSRFYNKRADENLRPGAEEQA